LEASNGHIWVKLSLAVARNGYPWLIIFATIGFTKGDCRCRANDAVRTRPSPTDANIGDNEKRFQQPRCLFIND
jgi:hypothetical protein